MSHSGKITNHINNRTRKAVSIIACAILVVIVVSVMVTRLLPSTELFDANDYVYSTEYSNELSNIPVIQQETSYTCGVVSMAIMKTHLGIDTTEQGLLAEQNLQGRQSGMLPGEYLLYASKVFSPMSYEVTLLNPTSEAEILNCITKSIENNIPVIIFYAAEDAWNPPHFNTHYGVIYGIDVPRGIVKISNPYGYFEEVNFLELFDSLDFASYPAKPLMFQLGRMAGMIRPNNLFVFSKAE